MRALLLCGAMFVAGISSWAEMPPCDKSQVGQFWPEEANRNPALAVSFAHNGELQVCSKHGWHYRWMQPSVTVDQLRNGKRKVAAAGEADRRELNDLKLRRSRPSDRAPQESSPSGQ